MTDNKPSTSSPSQIHIIRKKDVKQTSSSPSIVPTTVTAHTDTTLPSPISTLLFSSGVLCGGVVLGAAHQFRKAKFSFHWSQHKGFLALAARSFLAGTALCVGTIGFVSTTVAYFLGVNSIHEFDSLLRKKFEGKAMGPSILSRAEEVEKDKAKVFGMTKEQELKYWLKRMFEDIDEAEGAVGAVVKSTNTVSAEPDNNMMDASSKSEISRFNKEISDSFSGEINK